MDSKKLGAGILSTGALILGGVDASVLNEQPLERIEMVANERVEAKQIGNVVETTFPWKDQAGLKVKVDLGEPTLTERVADKRKQEVITETVADFDGGFKVDILLNEKPTTNVFCYAIQGAENYDFFYQPPLTKEELAEGASRPPEIEGSYAVYHKTLKNHQLGRENYATGKVMHIPRPQVWSMSDVDTKVWADMHYENGSLCVTVPQDFLDKAKYPVRVDPTFGYTSQGGTDSQISSVDGDELRAQLGTAPTGSLTSVSAYVRRNTVDANVQLEVWSDTGTVPNARLDGSENVAVTSTTYVLTTASVSENLTGLNYWVAVEGVYGEAGSQTYVAYDSGSGTGATRPLATWSANTNRYSVYGTYTEGIYTETYTTPGTSYWTAPTGVTEVIAACWGAGGGGGFISASGGAGGGGGAFASSTLTVTPGNTYNVSIGTGGAADVNSWADASSFSTSTCPDCVIASGGQGASPTTANTEGAGGTTASSTGTTKFAGGAGGDGNSTNDVGGGGGGSAGPHGDGEPGQKTGTASTTGGAGGNADAGSGGAGGAASAGVGNVGISNAFGGGGGGGANDNVGGNGGYPGGGGGGGETGGGVGGNGQCTITYTIPAGGGGGGASTDSGIIWFD